VVRVNRSTVLSLYRSILRLHQRKLSSDLRELADKYLKNEFKAHKKATEDQAREFMAQWLMYHEHLRQAKSVRKLLIFIYLFKSGNCILEAKF